MLKDVMMLGGGKKIKSVLRGESDIGQLNVIFLLTGLFLLRALVVQWTYNKIAPRFISNMGNSTQHFKPLTFEEALMFTLLISFLF
tara:strand:+ start:476 stop:733 length:258 start_codon:yes stop_codon:yes gene_type:complete